MCQTEHTVQTDEGQGYQVRVSHEDYVAIQYEFYIPETIWDNPSIQTFLQQLGSIQPNATIFQGLVGVWQGEPEQTRIYRMILGAGQFAIGNVRAALHSAIGSLMAELSGSAEHTQDTFMFSETDIRVTRSNGLTRI